MVQISIKSLLWKPLFCINPLVFVYKFVTFSFDLSCWLTLSSQKKKGSVSTCRVTKTNKPKAKDKKHSWATELLVPERLGLIPALVVLMC